jgi:hypothetical protein
LENLVAGRVENVITVSDKVKHWSNVALQRMLNLPSA